MLRVTHTSSVTEDMIDHLGHMNVRYYGVNALAGTRAVLAALPGWGDAPFLVHDSYTRHIREQMLGSDLEVRSAVLGLDAVPSGGGPHPSAVPSGGGPHPSAVPYGGGPHPSAAGAVRIHHQLANAATGELAATFVHGARPVDDDGAALPLPAAVLDAVRAEAVDLPPEGATRTISLDADLLGTAPALDTLLDRELAFRKPRLVQPGECGPDGRYLVEMAPALTWAGEQVKGEAPDHLHELPGGELMGWASMETRAVFGQLPRVGDRVQSFAASVAMHDKVIHRVNWAYDLDSGALLTAFESVSMAFDIRARRPMSIPEGYRRRESERIQPDLAPQAAA